MKSAIVLFGFVVWSVFSIPKFSDLTTGERGNRIDTLLVDEYDGSELFLSIQYRYIKGDTATSNILMKEQEDFLKSMGLPTSGLEEFHGVTENNMDLAELDKHYALAVEKLNGHKYQKLYRQVCSQIIIKRVCTRYYSLKDSIYFSRKLDYYLDEMRKSNGVNLGLIYAGLLKLKRHQSKQYFCSKIDNLLPYSDSLSKGSESNYMQIKNNDQSVLTPVDLFIFNDQKQRAQFDKEMMLRIADLKNKSCNL